MTILRPNSPGAKFDMNYYVTHHTPTVRERCTSACRDITAEGGPAGAEPGSKAPYIGAGHLTF